ncbi:MAG: flagellar basal-body rod protein FlgG [Syntrophobacteraceae bacterium]
MRSLWTAATGMAAQQMNMDVIAHNLANANTTGYKRSRGHFEDLMYQNIVPAGAETANNTKIPTGVQIGMGTKTISVEKIFGQGNFTETGNNLDMAVEGKGFFKVLRGTQESYTRNGSFKVDSEGYVTDSQGNRLQPEISIPKGTVTMHIEPGGTFTAIDSAGKVLTTVNMRLYDFPNPSGLQAAGHNYFITSPASGEVIEAQPGSEGLGNLLQGFLEASNINVVEEMVAMILSQRAYEANSKIIKSADQMLQEANNVKG